jgi:hypothetical protein
MYNAYSSTRSNAQTKSQDKSQIKTQTNQIGTLYRHGDVLIKRIADLPSDVQRREGVTLAHGEVTGHSHRMQQAQAVQLWERSSELFLEVKAGSATLIHEEHRAIELPQGVYRVWKQREYRPDAYVDVAD